MTRVTRGTRPWPGRRDLAIVVAMTAFGWAVASPLGIVAGLLAGAAAAFTPRLTLAAAVAAPALVGALTLTEGTLDERGVRTFVAARPRAHDAGLVMVIVWVAAAVVVWNRPAPDPMVSPAPPVASRPLWPLVVLVGVAVVATFLLID